MFRLSFFFSSFSHKSPSGLQSACVTCACVPHGNLVPRGPFCHTLEIGTPGQVRRRPSFKWPCKHNRLRPEQICQTRLWASAELREVRESRTSGVALGQRSTVVHSSPQSRAVHRVRMLKPRARDRAYVGVDCTISIETNKRQNGGRLKFRVFVFISRG